MSHIMVGDFRITLIREAIYHWDGGAVFGVVPKTLWSRKTRCDELNRVPMGFNCYLIETGDHTVLVETGAGDKMDTRARDRMKLPPEPTPLAVDFEGIDTVINSHLHWDHCGGNTFLTKNGGPRPAFPNARYYTRRGEWEHAHRRHPRDSVSYIDANYDPLVNSGRMCLIDSNCEIVPGVRVRHAPGHNRDMMVVLAESRDQTFCFFSDLVPSAAHLHPTWVAAFDLDPLQAIDNKTALLNEAATGNWVCGYGHDPEIAFTRIVLEGGKFLGSDERR